MNKKITKYTILLSIIFILNTLFIIPSLNLFSTFYPYYNFLTFILSSLILYKEKSKLIRVIKHLTINLENLLIIQTLLLYVISFINLLLNRVFSIKESFYFQNVIFNLIIFLICEELKKESKISNYKENLNSSKLTINPSEFFPEDGTIIKGNCYVDETLSNGSVIPQQKINGDKVLAGSKNILGQVEYELTNEKRKLPINERNNPEKNFKRKVILYLGISFITIVFISILKAKNISLNILYQLFNIYLLSIYPILLILLKDYHFINQDVLKKEAIKVQNKKIFKNFLETRTIIFDKTGTLTNGVLTISKIYNYSTYSNKKLLEIAYHLSKYSSEPIKYAFSNYFLNSKISNLSLNNIKKLPGVGVTAEYKDKKIYIGNSMLLKNLKIESKHELTEKKLFSKGESILYIIEENKILGLIALGDTIRKDASKVIDLLKKEKYSIILMSGDNKSIVEFIANKLDIDVYISNVSSKEKAEIIKDLQDIHKKIIYIGDGYNDIEAISISDIGISLSNNKYISTLADISIENGDLKQIIKILDYGKKTSLKFNRIKKNTLLLNYLFIIISSILIFTQYKLLIGCLYYTYIYFIFLLIKLLNNKTNK